MKNRSGDDMSDHIYCSLCGRKMQQYSSDIIRVEWRCPRWGNFPFWSSFDHDFVVLPDRPKLPNYDIKTGAPIQWDEEYKKKILNGRDAR